MTPGQFIYKYFFKPTLPLRYKIGHFGLAGALKMWQNENAMKKAAEKLSPIQLNPDGSLECSYLTGEKYWHQTIFCAYSLARVLDGNLKVNIYSDGSLSEKHISIMNKVLVNITIISAAGIKEKLESELPIEKFPVLRSLRETNAFFRKLVDMRLNKKHIIQLDSDMLFFNKPQTLIDAFNTGKSYYMHDTLDASYYVLPEARIESELNLQLREKINSGILAYNSSHIDWNYVEGACKLLLDNIDTIHPPMLEQTLNAIIISKLNGDPLDSHYRILYSDKGEITQNDDVVRHYIFKAKYPYLTSEWKSIVR